jgi:peptidoglycan-N-acetylglucosamine deacetylase
MRRPPIAACAVLVALSATIAADARSSAPPSFPSAAAQRRAVDAMLRSETIVSCGGPRGNAVALTFDDGPGPYTAKIIDVLRKAHAHATFFVVGDRLQGWPKLARAESRIGAVGNHTWSHPVLPTLPSWLVWLQLVRTQAAVEASTGRKPVLFRTPYAAHTHRTDLVSLHLGLVEVFWDVDAGDDVPNPRPDRIVQAVERGLRPGAIVLMHDIHPWTLRALPRILSVIRHRHLRAVSVPELLALDPPLAGRGCPYAPLGKD